MKPSYTQLEKRVAELERKLAALEARPEHTIHYHFSQPLWQQVPLSSPYMPPMYPITCLVGQSSTMIGGSSN